LHINRWKAIFLFCVLGRFNLRWDTALCAAVSSTLPIGRVGPWLELNRKSQVDKGKLYIEIPESRTGVDKWPVVKFDVIDDEIASGDILEFRASIKVKGTE
jgi:hypothetical protein